jgi:hypothetical protein
MKNFTQGMKRHLQMMFRWSPETSGSARITFFMLGILSTMWFLIRVIPKPSRATYPCMRAAAPVMSAFVIYLISISSSIFAFRRFKIHFGKARYLAAFGFLTVAVVMIFISGSVNNMHSHAARLVGEKIFTANDPIGVARGIHPGRVVWVWDRFATDSTCTNTSGNYWYQNTNAAQVDSMLNHGLMDMTGETSASVAWDAIFRYFNSNHGKGDVGYTAGEKIYIKINMTNSCCSVTGETKTSEFDLLDATPELSLALLHQLVDVVGVAQSDIYLGDPFRTFHNIIWDVCHSAYPDVVYCDEKGQSGRHQTVATDTNVIKFSDGLHAVRIPEEYMQAAYFINMPSLKTHNEGGLTLTAKNHQGSILEQGTAVTAQSAFVMHYSLPGPPDNPGMGKFRHTVDYMGHNRLGGNTLLFIVDGIWAGKNWDGEIEKWHMEPFINDYPSSLFLSQDEVAIQSVCYDFLLEEYKNKPTDEKFPYMDGADDFLYQAADPAYWPADIQYDPEGDGTVIGSLGVFEHWNNPSDKKYTRNLGSGDGIELVTDTIIGEEEEPPTGIGNSMLQNDLSLKNYPDPATDQIFFEYTTTSPGFVTAEVYNLSGRKIAVLKNESDFTGSHQLTWNVDELPAGIYLFNIEVKTSEGAIDGSRKFRVE